jgi:hypothetical protein
VGPKLQDEDGKMKPAPHAARIKALRCYRSVQEFVDLTMQSAKELRGCCLGSANVPWSPAHADHQK